jgi:hypothetical protein
LQYEAQIFLEAKRKKVSRPDLSRIEGKSRHREEGEADIAQHMTKRQHLKSIRSGVEAVWLAAD